MPSDPIIEQAFWSLLGAANRLRDRLDEVCAAHDLTYGQFVVLRILREAPAGGLSRGEIAQRMLERAPDVTRLVDRLDQRRLVSRDRAGDDQRRSLVRLTEGGVALLGRVQPAYEEVLRELADRVSLRDRHDLARICDGLLWRQ